MTSIEFRKCYGIGTGEVVACAMAGAAYGCTLLFVATPLAAASGAYLAAVVLLISAIDARRLIIPDFLSLPLVPLGIAVSAALSAGQWEQAMLERIGAAVAAAGALYAIRWAYRRVRQAEGLGLGDVKLMAAAGAWVGFGALAMTLLLASCAALAAVLVRQRFHNAPAIGRQTPVPFGSFIAPSILIMWTAAQWPS